MVNLESIRERFWGRIKRGLYADSCWEWQGYKAKSGYGMFNARAISATPLYSHRTAWQLTKGEIPEGLHVLHNCDNPACCNPSHLFLGTQRDNNADRIAKKRTASGDNNGARTVRENNPFVKNGGSGLRGESHPQSKLTDAQVEEMKQRFNDGETKAVLSRAFLVSQTTVGRILSGQSRKGHSVDVITP